MIEILRWEPLTKNDIRVLEARLMSYHRLAKVYKNRPKEWSDLYYQNVGTIVNGITEAYNECTAFEQNIIKLSYWDIQDDKIIAEVLGVKVSHVKARRIKILNLVANAILLI